MERPEESEFRHRRKLRRPLRILPSSLQEGRPTARWRLDGIAGLDHLHRRTTPARYTRCPRHRGQRGGEVSSSKPAGREKASLQGGFPPHYDLSPECVGADAASSDGYLPIFQSPAQTEHVGFLIVGVALKCISRAQGPV